jgi:DNA-binding NtrC family response regulator
MSQPRILLVDDEFSLLITLAANLELEGFDVTTAQSPIQALKLVKEQSFDIVLSDIRMPGMSGVDLFREIRRIHPKMPVLLMSAFALEETIKAAIHEGVFAMLAKPFDPDHVAAVLWKALRGSVVLVIDDTESDAITTTAALQSAGLKARAIFNREQATKEISAGEVDVCVLDLVMPGIDAEEFMKQIKANNSSIAVIAVSGYDVPELLRKVSSLGIYAFQQKPFNPDELIQLIAKARAKAPANEPLRKG